MTDPVRAVVFAAALVVASFAFFLTAVIAGLRGPSTRLLRLWSLFATCAGSFGVTLAACGMVEDRVLGEILVRAGVTAGVLCLLTLFLFALEFSGPSVARRPVAFAYSLAALTLLALLWGSDLVVAGAFSSEFAHSAPDAGPLIPLYLGYAAVGWLTPMFLFYRAIRSSSGLRRTQAGYMLLAFVVGCIATVSSILPSVFDSHSLLSISPTLLLALFPLIITCAMVRHRLWEVRTIAHQTAIWVILSAGLVLPVSFAVLALWPVIDELGPVEITAVLVGFFLVAHLYLRWAQPKLDHLFHRRDSDLRRALDRFDRQMTSLRAPEEVAYQLIAELDETLYPSWTRVLCRDSGRSSFEVASADATSSPDLEALQISARARRWLCRSRVAVDRSHLEMQVDDEGLRGAIDEVFEAVGAQVLVPLVHRDRLVGLVFLGEKRSLKPYVRGELEFLDRIGAAVAIGLDNALLFGRVDLQRRELEELTASLEQRVQQRTADLEAANVELKKLDQLKSRFFTNITHELRTPLALILAPLSSMLEGDLGGFEEQQLFHLRTIERNALRLIRLIDDLLDLSRLDEARLRLRLEPVDLEVLLSRVVETAAVLAQRKNVVLELQATGPLVAEIDEEKIERVVVNLVSNALKFTGAGGLVRFEATVVDDEVVVSVEDTGPGIDDDDLPRIFDRFFQANGAATRPHGGSGIGLSLARELVNLHGGALEVDSEPGRGSTFTLRLPCRATKLADERRDRRQQRHPVTDRRRSEDQGVPEWTEDLVDRAAYRYLDLDMATERRLIPREGGGPPRAARVLVVEDNPDMLRFLHQLLSERYEVWAVQDGERAWELLLRERHDLLLADIMMPGLSGLGLCQRVKATAETASIPVVLLTARSAADHRVQGHEAGADEYLIKPFNPRELFAVLKRLLAGAKRQTMVATRRREEAFESLLAGVAHELRNALHQVQGAQAAIEVVVEGSSTSNSDRLAALIGTSRQAVNRITHVVDVLGRYVVQGLRVPWTDVAIDDLARRQVELLGPDRAERIRLELRSEAMVRGPAEELRQLLLNLVENALDATADGGAVTVETRMRSGWVELRVCDEGRGISPQLQDRVFDLFFTTKDPGKGTGLGLALAKRTVEDIGGEITLWSRLGEGTEVRVELPARRAGVAQVATERHV